MSGFSPIINNGANQSYVSVAAAGTDQGTAAAISSGSYYNEIVSGTGNCVRLPPATAAGRAIFLVSQNSSTFNIFPASGEQIAGQSTNNPVVIAANGAFYFLPVTSSLWKAFAMLPLTTASQVQASATGGLYVQNYGIVFNNNANIAFANTSNNQNLVTLPYSNNMSQAFRLTQDGTLDFLRVNTTTSAQRAEMDFGLLSRTYKSNHNADITLAVSDSGRTLTNYGATATRTFTLPTPVGDTTRSLKFRFIVGAAQTLTVKAPASVTLRNLSTVSATAGTTGSSTVGSFLDVEEMSSTEYYVRSFGTWSGPT